MRKTRLENWICEVEGLSALDRETLEDIQLLRLNELLARCLLYTSTKEELAAREALCVHEQPAFCAAACPLRLDARELLGCAAKGDLATARAMLERASPFPGILAAGCEAPCKAACRLNEVAGCEAVDIPAIERAAMRHGAARTGKGLLKFKKKKTAAVFGAELFTLIVAGELAGKSYPTRFYVAVGSAEELIDKCAPFLCPEDRAAEIRCV